VSGFLSNTLAAKSNPNFLPIAICNKNETMVAHFRQIKQSYSKGKEFSGLKNNDNKISIW